MSTNPEQVSPVAEKTPLGKLMGVVNNNEDLAGITVALNQSGAIDVEVMRGTSGEDTMNQEQEAVAHSFLGDMESKMIQRYKTAVEQGNIVFAAIVEPHLAEQAAEMAKAHGAVEVVYFGNWVITNY